MRKDGIIEKIKASEWISNIVAVKKESGAILVCVDLCKVDKAVIVHGHPIPHIDDMLIQF